MARNFNPEKDIPDLSGKVILVTGGNIGLGKESIIQLSKHNPTKIFLLARNAAKARAAIDDIEKKVPKSSSRIVFVEMDLTSFDSIKRAAAEVQKQTKELHILMNNAGIMATPPGKTKEGYEIQFGTNHMGHALLTRLLLPTLLHTARGGSDPSKKKDDVRIVNLSSMAEIQGTKAGGFKKDDDFSRFKTDMASYWTFTRYGLSKLANVHHAKVLAKQHPEILSVSVHPGTVDTNLSNGIMQHYPIFTPFFKVMTIATKPFMTSVANGARNQLWAATSTKGDVVSGEFYHPVGVPNKGSSLTKDEDMAKRLWEWTEKELNAHA